MVSEQLLEVQKKFVWVVVALFLLAAVFAAREAAGASLSELISKAKQEGALNATASTGLGGRAILELTDAFRKRFGLDIRVTLTPKSDATAYAEAIAETRIGAVPSFDVLQGSGPNNVSLLGVKGIHKVDKWESLLAEINPLVREGKVRPEQVSPAVLRGYAFEFLSKVLGIVYNPRLISAADLPRTHAELGDPKYKGKWIQPPWTTHWDIGPFVFPETSKQEWLEIVRKAGKNVGAVLPWSRGLERVLLGEFSFSLSTTSYFFQGKARDPEAPIEIAFLEDYSQLTAIYHAVMKGARHPAAATLFALWMGTPEAEAIWQPAAFQTNIRWGQSEVDRSLRELVRKANANVVDLLSSKEGRDFLARYQTEEGRKYRQAIGKAVRGR